MTADQLGWILSQIGVLRAWAKAVEAEGLKRLAQSETSIPGMKLVEGRANRVWKNTDETRKTLLKMKFDLDEIAPREVLSPAQAEKLLKKAKKWNDYGTVLTGLITRPHGKLAIAPVTDPRPALTRGSEFTQLLETLGDDNAED